MSGQWGLEVDDVTAYALGTLGYPALSVHVPPAQVLLEINYVLNKLSRKKPVIKYASINAQAGLQNYTPDPSQVGFGIVTVGLPRLDPIAPLLLSSGPRLDIFGYKYCLTSDTSISLLDGRELTINELIGEYGTGGFWVYSCDKDGNIRPGYAHSIRKTGIQERLVKVTLDNGESVRCTPSHKWMMRDGSYCPAQSLRTGDSLMPLYRRLCDNGICAGYELSRTYKDEEFTHRLVADDFRNGVCEICCLLLPDKIHTIRHHRDFNRLNNSPTNLQWVTWPEHRLIHCDPARSRRVMTELWKDSEFQALMKTVFKDRGAGFGKLWLNQEFRTRISFLSSDQLTKQWEDPEFRARMIKKQKRVGFEVFTRLNQVEGFRNSGNHTRWKHPGSIEDCSMCSYPTNHKVVSVMDAGCEDVFDLTVNEHHNFALTAGVFISNSYPYRDISELEIDYMYFDMATRVLSSDIDWEVIDGQIWIYPAPQDTFQFSYAYAAPKILGDATTQTITNISMQDWDWIQEAVAARVKIDEGIILRRFGSQIPGTTAPITTDGDRLVTEGTDKWNSLMDDLEKRTPEWPFIKTGSPADLPLTFG